MTEPLDLDAIRGRAICLSNLSGPTTAGLALTAAASARDVPALLAEVERLRAQLAEAEVDVHVLEQSEDARVVLLEAERDTARAEVAELRELFDLQWTRTQEATALWRAESPAERANVMPDLGALLTWLMRRIQVTEEERDDYACRFGVADEAIGDMRPVVEAAKVAVTMLRLRGYRPGHEWLNPETATLVEAVDAWRQAQPLTEVGG